MPLSRALLPVGALAALLLGGCAGTPPPASAPLPAGLARVLLPAELQPLLVDGSAADASLAAALEAPRGRCDPGDPMAFDPGPRVDSLAILRVPGRGAASMPNACPVDPRFQGEQATSRVWVRGTSTKVPR